jgi:enoyl-CoA hydratase/carnithine racemase
MREHANDVTTYLRDLIFSLHEAMCCFMRMDAPVIAAVNGTAAQVSDWLRWQIFPSQQ